MREAEDAAEGGLGVFELPAETAAAPKLRAARFASQLGFGAVLGLAVRCLAQPFWHASRAVRKPRLKT